MRAAKRCTADGTAQIRAVCSVAHRTANGFRAEIHVEAGCTFAVNVAGARAQRQTVVYRCAGGRHISGHLTHGEYFVGLCGTSTVCDFGSGFVRTEISTEARIAQRTVRCNDFVIARTEVDKFSD